MPIRSDVGPPRGVLTRGDAADTRFDHLRRAPSPDLREHVAHLWMVRWDLSGQAPVTVATLPHPTVHITVEARRAQVGGVKRGRFTRRLSGRGRVFGIKFRPAAFQSLVGGSMARLTDRALPIGAIFGTEGERFARALRGEPDEERCIVLCEAFIRPRLRPLDAMAQAVRDLVERLAVDRELLRAEQAAALLDVDLRQLQRLFRNYVGVSPKWVIQRYRLHEAAALIDAGQAGTLASLAQSLGYFDQAHFIRDFKAAVGHAPGARSARR
jgi:AraC-like DNA-binding protein